MIKYIFLYLLVINIIGFFIMYYDKRRSIKKKWRVPEVRLFFIAIIFGSLGILSGMYSFHHKTKHRKFVLGIPIILFLQICVIITLILSFKV